MNIKKGKPVEKAVRKFTDREAPRAAFWKNYNSIKEEIQQGTEKIHVLNYYGIGGIGKSRLLKQLKEEMEAKISAPKYIHIDIKDEDGCFSLLRRMRNKLANDHNFHFPLYDTAYYLYAKKIGEKPDPIEIEKVSEKNPLIKLMFSVADNIPLINVVTKALETVDEGVALIRTQIQKNQNEIRQIDVMTPEELRNYLPHLFSLDMIHNMEKHMEEPLVIFMDTYELLVNELSSVGDPLQNDKWLRDEAGPIQNVSNILWVIAGREKLKWEIFDSDWNEAIDSHILGNLSVEDSKSFLQEAGITDAKLCEHLCKLTGGTPVYLDLCVTQYETMLEKNQVPDATKFGKNTYELISRFLAYMDDPQKDLIKILVCLNKWNDELIKDLLHCVPNISITTYEKVKDYSFVNKLDDGDYQIHQTIAKVLFDDCSSIIKETVGNYLFETYSKAFTPERVSSPIYSTALIYVAQAGLLLHENRDKLYEFFVEHICTPLKELCDAGFFDAVQNVLDLFEEKAIQNKDDLFYISFINQTSHLLYEKGDYSHALALQKIVLEKYKAKFYEDHPDTLMAMHNLARTYRDLGKLEEALALQQIVLEKRKVKLGEDHPDTLMAMHNLAITYGDLGKHEEALALKQIVLEEYKARFGDDHTDTLMAMNNLAYTYGALGKLEEALALQQIVLEKRKARFGEDHPDTLRAMNNLASTYRALGKHKEALALQQIVFEKLKARFGDDHPDTLRTMNNLANTYGDLGKHEEALALKQIVLEKYKARFGDDHPDTLMAMHNLAGTYGDLGKHEEALALRQIVLEKRKARFGEDHPDTLMAMNNLASTYGALDKLEEALELKQIVLEKHKAKFDEDHPYTLMAMHNLASTYGDLGKHKEVLALKQIVLEKYKAKLGDDHPYTLMAMNNLASTYGALGKHEEALALQQIVLEKRKAKLGDDHPYTLSAMHNLIYYLQKTGEVEKALELAKEYEKYCPEK